MQTWTQKQIVLLAVFFSCLWIGVPIWIWRNIPSDDEYKWNRLMEVEVTLKSQKQVVDLAILEEEISEYPSEERIKRLKKIQNMLNGVDDL